MFKHLVEMLPEILGKVGPVFIQTHNPGLGTGGTQEPPERQDSTMPVWKEAAQEKASPMT